MSAFIGIDLGTTNSCISYYNCEKDCPEIIPTKESKRLTPSHVLYDYNGKKYVGEKAQKICASWPKNHIYDTKRMIGRLFSDPEIQKNLQNWPFTVTENRRGECQITVTLKDNKTIHIRPEEVAAEILKKLKEDASTFLKQPINEVVITVPAYFTESQRNATEDAARLANLKVLNLMSEPTAAALAYANDKVHLNRTILVYDLGGGTFDISLVKFCDGSGEVIATDGHPNLGGRDFDNNFLAYVLRKCFDKYKLNPDNFKQHQMRHFVRRILVACQDAKEAFSTKTMYDIQIDNVLNDLDIELEVSRDTFNELNIGLFKQTIRIVHAMLSRAKITKENIDDVVLVGGSTRIKAVVDLLTQYFDGKQPSHGINPDEAVAQGAALQAARLNGCFCSKEEIVVIHDSTPFSLGIAEGEDDRMDVIIAKNTKIPVIKESNYETIYENQTNVKVAVYQGDNEFVKDNQLLGEFIISDITPLKAGEVKIIVTFSVSLNNTLTVTAKETSKNTSKNLTISIENSRYSQNEFDEALQRVANNDSEQ